MEFTLKLQPAYGWVIVDAIFSIFILKWMALSVGMARKRFGIEYPNLYAIPGISKRARNPEYKTLLEAIPDEDCNAFNCYQRAHQNTLENYPEFLVLLLVGGLQYPLIASVSGLFWNVGKILYAVGYQTGGPKGRFIGMVSYLGLFPLLGLNVLTAWNFIKGITVPEGL
jgi:glutathione S-transferase